MKTAVDFDKVLKILLDVQAKTYDLMTEHKPVAYELGFICGMINRVIREIAPDQADALHEYALRKMKEPPGKPSSESYNTYVSTSKRRP